MGESRDYHKRLEALNGGPLPLQNDGKVDVETLRRALRKSQNSPLPATKPADPIIYRRSLPSQRGTRNAELGTGCNIPSAAIPTHPPCRTIVALNEAVHGYEVTVPQHGRAFHIETSLEDMGEEHLAIHDAFLRAFAPDSGLQQRLAQRCAMNEVSHEDVLFVDIETTGLSHSPLFLIGILSWEGSGLVVRQFLARHYGEEAAVTALFIEQAVSRRLLISFNGKSFDYPYIRMRAAANALPCPLELAHFDLLHESRRIWKGILPNCKLQTLEQIICGRPPRYGDIPGADIPEAYHRYVRTANAAQLVTILKHNLLDLVTLAELVGRLPGI